MRSAGSPSRWRGGAVLTAAVITTIVAADRLVARFLPAPKTTLFLRDPELGWRYRPGAVDSWDGVVYRINQKGLRGPELAYERPPGTLRLLFLGDSVTAGAGLPRYEDAFPERTAVRLRELYPAWGVESVNAGVNGYAPWQEGAYLRREGYRYQPDLVVVGFVLNDVTAKRGRARAGREGGRQLAGTVSSTFDRIVHASGLARGAVGLGAWLRFGRDTRRGAIREESLGVWDLARAPDRADVQQAWRETLAEVDAVVATCRQHGLPLVLVAFPYPFQIGNPEAAAPQAMLADYARSRGLPFLDLLPPVEHTARTQGLTQRDCFLDYSHPTALCHRLFADVLADFVVQQNLLVSLQEPQAASPLPGRVR